MIKCGKTGSARPTINCTAMIARMIPGTVEPTGVVASSPRHSMIMPNECGKVDVSQPTMTYSGGARRMTSCSTRELGARFFVSVGMSCNRVSRLRFLRFFIAEDAGCSRAALSITSQGWSRSRASSRMPHACGSPCWRYRQGAHKVGES
jgi:hypothetical protein